MPKVIYLDRQISCQIQLSEQLLDVFEMQGYHLPHGCLAGSCGVCVVEIMSGAEQFEAPTKVELNTLQRLYPNARLSSGSVLRLGCRLKLIQDLKIEIHFKTFKS